MSLNFSTTHLAPLLLRQTARQTVRRTIQAQRQVPAIALLVSQRHINTETSNSTSGGNYPPPGFNAEQARKPLPKESQEQQKSAQPSKKSDDNATVKIPLNQPTEHAPTKAAENMSLSEMAKEKSASSGSKEKSLEKKKEEEKKLTLGQKIMKEVHHYWDGTKLLATEVKISSKLALKMAAGYELNRREHRQLQRTVQDLGRLVPFSVFVIVPFAELLLPVALKLFPNLLPSTYEGQKSKEAKIASLRSSRKEVSNFLRDTLRESGLPVSAVNAHKEQKEEFAEFFRKVRATGESPTKTDVINVCKIFKDDLTLDNLSRPQLVGICRYMSQPTFGTDAMLRYHIRHRMRQIKRDDRAIAYEGVESLSVPELQAACQSRGLRTQGMSPGRLRDDLHMWLDLRLKHGIPSTLLVLSNAFMYAQGKDMEFDTQIDALKAVLSSIPEELFHEIELEVHNAEGAATNKQRLEVLREQQELIEEENEQSEKQGDSKSAKVSDRENIDEDEKDMRQEAALRREEEAETKIEDSKSTPPANEEKK
ncbi:LETM1 domain-containing protein mdm28, mitochondrial [Elsinoe australis]|uniref:LETM1 domain-containing protein mdm28, mitochondrial n=1 Tax=Elsinoe australis TaxID=40998 RepID=A0A2P8AI37_9PEZI|nr:LETM1 domain-containing protein mdm28, mitochondrial [Elsinoe australis]